MRISDWSSDVCSSDLNSGIAKGAAIYVQDQVTFSPQWQAVVGVRFDRFDLDLRNNRNGTTLTSADGLISPRAGLIYKPAEPVSIYASYSRPFLPRPGEPLSSLSLTNQIGRASDRERVVQ